LKRIFSGFNANYYLKNYDLILYQSNINFLDNHRALMNRGLFKFNAAKYKYHIKLDFKDYQKQLSGYPLTVIDNFYNQLSIQYKINIGTLDHPYHYRE